MEVLECGHEVGPFNKVFKTRACETCENILKSQGYRWCYGCKAALPYDRFRSAAYGRELLRSKCKLCQSAYGAEWYQKNKQKVDARAKFVRALKAKRAAHKT